MLNWKWVRGWVCTISESLLWCDSRYVLFGNIPFSCLLQSHTRMHNGSANENTHTKHSHIERCGLESWIERQSERKSWHAGAYIQICAHLLLNASMGCTLHAADNNSHVTAWQYILPLASLPLSLLTPWQFYYANNFDCNGARALKFTIRIEIASVS